MSTRIRSLSILVLAVVLGCLSSLVTSCALPPATPTPPVAMLYLLEVRDKETGLAIPRNEMIIRRETPEGELISETTFQNQTRFAIQIPADGSQRVFIEIKAEGYQPWQDNFRVINMSDSYLEFTADLEKAP